VSAAALALEGVRVTFVSQDGTRYTAIHDTTLRVAPGEFVSVVGPDRLRQVDAPQRRGRLAAALCRGGAASSASPCPGLNRKAGLSVPDRGAHALAHCTRQRDGRVGISKNEKEEAKNAAKRGCSASGCAASAALSAPALRRHAKARRAGADADPRSRDHPHGRAFSALDIQTRHLMENQLLEIWSANRKSVVFITHDLERRSRFPTAWSCSPRVPRRIRSASSRSTCRVPADVAEVRLEPRFIELHTQIWHAMKAEVLKSYARQNQ
jgi:NitT/TauT family transport system ATP-binding protein